MKKSYFFILLGVLSELTVFAQYSPSGKGQAMEKQKIQISAPLKQTMFSIREPRPADAPSILFDSLNMSYQGSWGFGQSFSVSSDNSGHTLFIGSGSGVIILDVTNPSAPVKISELSTRGLVDAIYYDENTDRLYVTAYFAGFEIWDVSTMSAPVRIGGGETTGLPRGGIFADGNYVYVVTVVDGVQVYDVTVPTAPVNVGNCTLDPSYFVWNSAKSGNLIFAALSEGGMAVVDVTDPVNPVIAGTYGFLTNGVWAANGYVYSASWDGYFHVLDISDLSNITEIGYCSIEGVPERVGVVGNYAYVGNATSGNGGGINVVDITNATSPQYLTTYSGYATNITAHGNMVAFTGSSVACTILDITNQAAPVLANLYKLPTMMIDIALNGNYAYTGDNGFRVFDITDKTHPVQIGYDTNDGATVRVSGTKAVYIRESMSANNPVMVMDIADPTNPHKVGEYMAPVMTNDLELKDHYAFVGCWWDGFRVIDFQDPSNPVLVAHKMGWTPSGVPGETYCYVQALDIEGNYLYLIDYAPFTTEDTRGLYIWDITDPLNPVFVKRFVDFMSGGYDIDAVGNYVYVSDMYGGLEVIDVTDKTAPVGRGYITLPDGANQLAVKENHAFVADYINGGVQAVNVTDPMNPEIDGYYAPTGCFALGVSLQGNDVFVSDGAGGMQIYNTTLVTGTGKDKILSESRAYPDPFIDHVTISINKGTEEVLSIYDISGKLAATVSPVKKTSESAVYIWKSGNAAPGLYYFKTASGSASGKIVKAQ